MNDQCPISNDQSRSGAGVSPATRASRPRTLQRGRDARRGRRDARPTTITSRWFGHWSLLVHWPLLFLSGCSFAPKYAKPAVQTPAAFKELAPSNFKDTEGWKTAEPKDEAVRGQWWEMFGDAQ